MIFARVSWEMRGSSRGRFDRAVFVGDVVDVVEVVVLWFHRRDAKALKY